MTTVTYIRNDYGDCGMKFIEALQIAFDKKKSIKMVGEDAPPYGFASHPIIINVQWFSYSPDDDPVVASITSGMMSHEWEVVD